MEHRHYTNKTIEFLEMTGEMNDTVLSLLNYLSDDDVKDWAEMNYDIDFNEEDKEECIVEYYYDPKEKLWRADVLDEDNNIVDFDYAATENEIKTISNSFNSKYDIIRITKTKFYK